MTCTPRLSQTKRVWGAGQPWRTGRLAGALMLVAVAFGATAGQSWADSDASSHRGAAQRVITVSGTGQVAGAPDMAIINLGVETQAKTAREALSQNSTALAQVVQRLKGSGIADRDLQTSNFNIMPEFKRYPRGETGPQVIIGYTVSNMLTVRVRDLDTLGPILDAAVSDGANRFRNLSFTFSEPEPLAMEAKRRAVRNARALAELYAEEAGVTLGPVLRIREGGGGERDLARGRATMMAEAAPPPPMQAGESTVFASVAITYALKDKNAGTGAND